MFRWAQTSLKTGLADYIKFGEAKFGADKVGECITQLEFPLADITKAVDINSVPAGIRKQNLSAEHLVVLARADVTPKQQEKWAETAVKENLSAVQLKESIKQGTVVSAAVAAKNNHGVITIHGIRMEADIWLRRMGGLEGIAKLGKEERDEIIGETQLFVDIHKAASGK